MDAANLFDVKGKVVLVTGGGRGVGEMVSSWERSRLELKNKNPHSSIYSTAVCAHTQIATGYVANGAKVSASTRKAETNWIAVG